MTTLARESILSHMDNHSDALKLAFSALADPTRRAIVSRLCQGPATVGELSEPFDMALPSLLKHVRVLEESGLVRSEKIGRSRICRVEQGALRTAEGWLREHISIWEKRLDRLEAHVKHTNKET